MGLRRGGDGIEMRTSLRKAFAAITHRKLNQYFLAREKTPFAWVVNTTKDDHIRVNVYLSNPNHKQPSPGRTVTFDPSMAIHEIVWWIEIEESCLVASHPKIYKAPKRS